MVSKNRINALSEIAPSHNLPTRCHHFCVTAIVWCLNLRAVQSCVRVIVFCVMLRSLQSNVVQWCVVWSWARVMNCYVKERLRSGVFNARVVELMQMVLSGYYRKQNIYSWFNLSRNDPSPYIVFTIVINFSFIDEKPGVGHCLRVEIIRHHARARWHLANIQVVYRPRRPHITLLKYSQNFNIASKRD